MARRWRIVAMAAVVAAGCSGDGGDLPDRPRASPSGRAVIGDNLSTNASGWTEVDEADASVTLDGGDLVVETTRVEAPIVASPRSQNAELFDVETAVDLAAGPAGPGERGVVCRRTDDQWYAFTIDDDGTAAIALWDAGVRTLLGSAPYQGEPRRLAGRCLGGIEGGDGSLLLILDGLETVVATDETALGSGQSGVFARASTPDPLTARFERFEVRELPGGTTRLPAPEPFGGLPEEGFSDDFSGAQRPFGELPPDAAGGDFAAEYEGGTYRLRADGFVQRSAPVDPLPDRAVVEVTVVKVSSGPSWRGVKWAEDEDRYYEVAIDDRTAMISYVDGDRSNRVELVRADDVDGILGGGTEDRIRSELVRADGEVRITLVVNDRRVLTVTDEDRWGDLRFAQLFVRTNSESTEPAEARFDDFSLQALP